jgi:hypothetical protein
MKGESLIPMLHQTGLTLDMEAYADAGTTLDEFLIEVPDFNSLVATSQECSKPVFKLTKAELESAGYVLNTQEESVERFRQIYGTGADKVIALSQYA